MISDNEITLCELWDVIRSHLEQNKMAASSISCYYYYGMKPIIDRCRELQAEKYDADIVHSVVESFAKAKGDDYSSNKTAERTRKIEHIITTYLATGMVCLERIKPAPRVSLNEYYEEVVSGFSMYLKRSHDYCRAIEIEFCSIARKFFAFITEKRVDTVSDISRKQVADFLIHVSPSRPCSMDHVLLAMRRLSDFLVGTYEVEEFNSVLLSRPSPRRKMMPVFSEDDVSSLINEAEKESKTPLRDTAMYMLDSSLGLRSIDLANLTLDDFDWRTNTLRFTQHKTSVELVLPLETEVGNAVANYILHERPQTKSRILFIRSRAPYTGISAAGLRDRLIKHMDLSPTIDRSPGDKKGMHSIRRYVASTMVNNDVSVYTVKDVLGHQRIQSMKPYVRVSDKKLSLCALGTDGIEPSQEIYL